MRTPAPVSLPDNLMTQARVRMGAEMPIQKLIRSYGEAWKESQDQGNPLTPREVVAWEDRIRQTLSWLPKARRQRPVGVKGSLRLWFLDWIANDGALESEAWRAVDAMGRVLGILVEEGMTVVREHGGRIGLDPICWGLMEICEAIPPDADKDVAFLIGNSAARATVRLVSLGLRGRRVGAPNDMQRLANLLGSFREPCEEIGMCIDIISNEEPLHALNGSRPLEQVPDDVLVQILSHPRMQHEMGAPCLRSEFAWNRWENGWVGKGSHPISDLASRVGDGPGRDVFLAAKGCIGEMTQEAHEELLRALAWRRTREGFEVEREVLMEISGLATPMAMRVFGTFANGLLDKEGGAEVPGCWIDWALGWPQEAWEKVCGAQFLSRLREVAGRGRKKVGFEPLIAALDARQRVLTLEAALPAAGSKTRLRM